MPEQFKADCNTARWNRVKRCGRMLEMLEIHGSGLEQPQKSSGHGTANCICNLFITLHMYLYHAWFVLRYYIMLLYDTVCMTLHFSILYFFQSYIVYITLFQIIYFKFLGHLAESWESQGQLVWTAHFRRSLALATQWKVQSPVVIDNQHVWPFGWCRGDRGRGGKICLNSGES